MKVLVAKAAQSKLSYLRLLLRASLEGDNRLLSLWLSVLSWTEHRETKLFIARMPQPCAMTSGHC